MPRPRTSSRSRPSTRPPSQRSGCRTRTRSRTAPRSSAQATPRLLAGSTLDGSFALVRRVARARPGIPLVTMGYANQLIGGGDGRERAARLVEAGAAGVIVADMTPDEARRSRRPRPMQVWPSSTWLPRRPARRRAAIAARSGGFLYCVSLVGVTGARSTWRPSASSSRGQGRVAGPGRGRLRREPAGTRPVHRESRGRRGRGRLGARRRARPRRPGRAADGPPRSIAP